MMSQDFGGQKKATDNVRRLKEAGEEILKESPDIKTPNKIWEGCDDREVPLCKTGVCRTKWHSQDAR